MVNIFLTGASGHIGNYILDVLICRFKPQIIDKKLSLNAFILPKDNIKKEYLKYVNIIHGDVRNFDDISSKINEKDIVIHLAGIISIAKNNASLMNEVNYEATKNIANICLKRKAYLLYTSSVHVLKADESKIINEDAGFNTNSKRGPYEHSKSLATAYIYKLFDKGLNGTIFYPSAIIGPEDKFVGEVSNALIMLYKRKMPAYIKGGYSFVDVRDVANAICNAINNEKANKKGYILSAQYISIKGLMNLVYDYYGYKHKPGYCPLFLVYLGLPFITLWAKITKKKAIFTKIMLKTVLSNGNFDNSRAKKDLDFRPRPLIESIKDQIDWLKINHSELF